MALRAQPRPVRHPVAGSAPPLAAVAGRGRDRRAGLPSPVRTRMETRFCHDFSRVRVDTSPAGAAAADAAGLAAFTRGTEITFAPGHYAPETAAGDRLLTHELAHVVQQDRGGAGTGGAGAAGEREADWVAEAGGGPVHAGAPSGSVQGQEKKKAVSGEASFGERRERKEGKATTKTEGKLSLTVPVLPDGTFGPVQLLEDAKFTLKAGESREELDPDDPAFSAQLDIALTLAKAKLLEEPFAKGAAGSFTLPSSLKLSLGAGAGVSSGEGKATLAPKAELSAFGYKLPELSGGYGKLGGGVDLSATAGAGFATGTEPTAEIGSKLAGKLTYTSPELPYRPYGPTGPTRHGQFTVGGKATLSAGYATDKGRKLFAGVGASAGYQWPSLHGVQPTVTLDFDVSWTEQEGKVTSSHVTAISFGAKF
ncbi:MAG: DUF4157 domain-containing protein [Actinobacteria bacterium]|nr:DUF4157 domain-containing protein [Actinomycetota bacterium]